MPGFFFLADDLAPDGPAAVLARVAPAMADRFRVGVGVLSRPTGPVDDALTVADLTPGPLPVRGLLDLAGLRQVRKWVAAFAPDVLHAIGPRACQVAAFLRLPMIGLKKRPRLIVSGVADGHEILTHRAVQSADRVLVETEAQAIRMRETGVTASRVRVVPPGIVPPTASLNPAAFRESLGIPATGRLIVAAGRFDAAAELKSAVWAFDVVKYVAPDVYLVLCGDGPERGRVERFARALGFDDYRVRFAGVRTDLPAVLGLAEVVWVTHRHGGVTTALEAMAAGRPVVAFRTPDLAGIVADGVTGRLVPPGDRVQLAAVTHELLEQPTTAAALGAAGRAAVLDRFSAGRLADAYASVYHEFAEADR